MLHLMTPKSSFSWVLGLLWKAGGGSEILCLLSCADASFLKILSNGMLVRKQESAREIWAMLFASRAVLNSLPLHQKIICLPMVEGCVNAPHRRETICSVRLPLPFPFYLRKTSQP